MNSLDKLVQKPAMTQQVRPEELVCGLVVIVSVFWLEF